MLPPPRSSTAPSSQRRRVDGRDVAVTRLLLARSTRGSAADGSRAHARAARGVAGFADRAGRDRSTSRRRSRGGAEVREHLHRLDRGLDAVRRRAAARAPSLRRAARSRRSRRCAATSLPADCRRPAGTSSSPCRSPQAARRASSPPAYCAPRRPLRVTDRRRATSRSRCPPSDVFSASSAASRASGRRRRTSG